MNYYYVDANNQPAGPLPLDEIHQKAAAGLIPSNPMIAAAGTNEWHPLGGGGTAAPAAAFQFDQIWSNLAAAAVRVARAALSVNFLDGSLNLARDAGHYLVAAGGVLGLVYGLFVAVKMSAAMIVVSTFLLLVWLAVAQFAGRRFFGANQQLLTPSRVSSTALLECVALLMLLGAVATVITAITACVQMSVWQPLVPAVLIAAFWTYFGAVALHPETVSVEIGPGSGGEQVVGLLLFFAKTMLKLVPLCFVALAALGCLAIALSFFEGADAIAMLIRRFVVPLPPGLSGLGFVGVGAVVFACLLPLVAHVLFITVSLPLDLWRAIFAVPAKLDALKR